MQETVLKRAKNYYENCELIIKELCNITKEWDEPIDEDGAVTELDVMMLSLLFSMAISDGDFCENEKEFIKSFPNSDNYFKFFTKEEQTSLTWDKVFAMTCDEQQALAEDLNALLNRSANSFAIKFAVLDAITTQSYISEIALNLSQIGLLISMVDGEITAEELETLHAYTDELVVGKWAYYVEAFQSILNKEDSTEE